MMNENVLAMLLAQGQAPKKKKRGGLAGVWDRNKHIAKPLISGALGLVPGIGVGLAAGAGALMGGLDREGKGGIGFDVGQGVSGGIAGAAAGAAGKFLGGKMGIGAPPVPAPAPSAGGAIDKIGNPIPSAPPVPAARGLGNLNMGRIGAFVEKHPQAVGMGLQGLSGILGSQRDGRIEAERLREERRRAENLGLFAAPLYRNMGGQ